MEPSSEMLAWSRRHHPRCPMCGVELDACSCGDGETFDREPVELEDEKGEA